MLSRSRQKNKKETRYPMEERRKIIFNQETEEDAVGQFIFASRTGLRILSCQSDLVESLRVSIQAAQQRQDVFGGIWLFSGPPGLGKTSLGLHYR